VKKIFPILPLHFVNVLGFSLLIPVLPSVIAEYSGVNQGLLYGLLLSSYSFMQFIAAPYLGKLSDRYGRRLLLILSQIGTLLSWIIFASAYFLPDDLQVWNMSVALLVILFARIFDGLTGGNVSVAHAWVSDRTNKSEKTKAFGIVGAVYGFGFLLGPALGGFSVATPIAYLGTAILAIIISLVTLVVICVGLPESLPKAKRKVSERMELWQHLNFFAKFRLFRENKKIRPLLSSRVVFALVYVAVTTSMILLFQNHYLLIPIELGFVISVVGLFSIVNQAFIVPFVERKIGLVKTFYVGLLLTAVSLLILPLLPWGLGNVFWGWPFWLFLINSFPFNLGLSMVITSFKALITTSTHESAQGEATGLDESITSFGHGVAPLFAGLLYDQFSFWIFGAYGAILIVLFAKCIKFK
jgi:MFS transporter, DHA1 family, tetracycline resistance protein